MADQLEARIHDAIHAVAPDTQIIFETYAARSQYDALLSLDPLPQVPVVCVALDGAGFHGQHARSWSTAPGNLFFCAKLESAHAPRTDALPWLQCVGPLAVAQTIAPVVAPPVRLKWINDVLVNDQKIAGILTHYRQLRARHCAFWGIGLNVECAPPVDQPVTCLRDVLNPQTAFKTDPQTPFGPLYIQILAQLYTNLQIVFNAFMNEPENVKNSYEKLLK